MWLYWKLCNCWMIHHIIMWRWHAVNRNSTSCYKLSATITPQTLPYQAQSEVLLVTPLTQSVIVPNPVTYLPLFAQYYWNRYHELLSISKFDNHNNSITLQTNRNMPQKVYIAYFHPTPTHVSGQLRNMCSTVPPTQTCIIADWFVCHTRSMALDQQRPATHSLSLWSVCLTQDERAVIDFPKIFFYLPAICELLHNRLTIIRLCDSNHNLCLLMDLV